MQENGGKTEEECRMIGELEEEGKTVQDDRGEEWCK